MVLFCRVAWAQDVSIIDAQHYSHAFGETRNFRIFLPPGYDPQGAKKYPVIYFLHGWAQRYFGEGAEKYAGYDKGDDNNGDHIAAFVLRNEVIVVKSDGYNRRIDEPYYVRPYNVLPVETYRQFPIYFPELINYIDEHYNTLADRQHRAISGLSMGGFMSFWIAGKYPQLFSAVGSFCGAPEFIVGPQTHPVEYRHIDMYRNYRGVKVRLHFGDKDFIRDYHADMNRVWPEVMDNYQWKIYPGEHSTAGMGEMFDFFMQTFKNPPAEPVRWDHTDLYPDFTVWDYRVSTNRTSPGFTVLENVDKKGFRISVREFVPDGELLTNVSVTIITPPVYRQNTLYAISDADLHFSTSRLLKVRSDQEGRLRLTVSGSLHEIGINETPDAANLTIANFETSNIPLAIKGREVALNVNLLNNGRAEGKDITAELIATRPNVKVIRSNVTYGSVPAGKLVRDTGSFLFVIDTGDVDMIQLRLDIKERGKKKWTEFIEIPVENDVSEIKDFVIADGRWMTVASSGNDQETLMLGNGNGDGKANPGESVVILVKDRGRYWRTDITCSDLYINPHGVNQRKSDHWTKFDFIGASMKYDIPLISSDAPQGHAVEMLVKYWLPEYPYHHTRVGVVKMMIGGEDRAVPLIGNITVRGDNTVEAKVADGSKIRIVKATFILTNTDSPHIFQLELRDDGMNGDRVIGDNVYSLKIPEQKFGLYRVIVEAEDAHANTNSVEGGRLFVVR